MFVGNGPYGVFQHWGRSLMSMNDCHQSVMRLCVGGSSEQPVVVVKKVIGEGVKVKVIELGLTVVLSERNKIFIKVGSRQI